MFTSGMTLQEVIKALDLELSEKEAREKPAEVSDTPHQVNEPETDRSKMPPEVLDDLFALIRTVQKLGSESYSLAGHEKVRSSESLAEISKKLSLTTQTVAKLVTAISRFAPEIKPHDMGEETGKGTKPAQNTISNAA
jgi:hypothetical protein